jgi:hypothetical protein
LLWVLVTLARRATSRLLPAKLPLRLAREGVRRSALVPVRLAVLSMFAVARVAAVVVVS